MKIQISGLGVEKVVLNADNNTDRARLYMLNALIHNVDGLETFFNILEEAYKKTFPDDVISETDPAAPALESEEGNE